MLFASFDCSDLNSVVELLRNMDRSRSPRRQHLSWMQPASAASSAAGVVLPASQLQWTLPGIDLPLPPPSSGKGAQPAAQCGYGKAPSAYVSQPSHPTTGFPTFAQSMHAKALGKGAAQMGQTQSWQTPHTAVGPCPTTLPGKGTPDPPATIFGPPLPSSFRSDPMFLDTNLVGGLQLPRFVKTSDFTRRKGIAGCPASAVPIHALMHHGWSSWWLRRLCDGKEVYMGMFKEVAEVVFAHSLFQALRSNHVSLDAIAEHVARDEGQSGDRTWCSGVLAAKVAEYIQSLQPAQRRESDQVTAMQLQIQELQKQLAAQSNTARPPQDAQAGNPVSTSLAPDTSILPDDRNATQLPQAKVQASLASFFQKPEASTSGIPASPAAPSAVAPESGAGGVGPVLTEPEFGSIEHVQQVMDNPTSSFLDKKWVQMRNDREVKDWISKLKLTKKQSTDLHAWTESVQAWFESLSAGTQAKLDHQAVQWGVPIREIAKLKQQPLLRIVAVASKMSL